MEQEQLNQAIVQMDTVRKLSEMRGEVSVILRGIRVMRGLVLDNKLPLDADIQEVYQQVIDTESAVVLLHRRLERMAQAMADKALAALDSAGEG